MVVMTERLDDLIRKTEKTKEEEKEEEELDEAARQAEVERAHAKHRFDPLHSCSFSTIFPH